MKVIQTGTTDETIRMFCRHCHSVVEFLRSETTLKKDRSGNFVSRTIQCGACSKTITMGKYE